MGLQNDKKLNELLKQLPEGVVAPSRWLTGLGYSRQLLYKYVQNNWLEKAGQGVFLRPGTPLEWKGVVLGLQKLGGLSYHVGGITALNQQGHGHYLPLGNEVTIHLYGSSKLPAWTRNINLSQKLMLHTKKLFADELQNIATTTVSSGVRDWDMIFSTPERAIFEVLDGVKSTDSEFQHAAELFEGLTLLRPRLINQLLAHCKRVRTKRLFLFLANYYNHPWMKRLETDSVQLGSGKIQLIKGGRMEKKYLITIPEAYFVS